MRRLVLSLAFAVSAAAAWGQSVVHDVIYARENGSAFTMDVFKPAKPNGAGIIWVCSAGWYSNHEMINPGVAQPFLDKGFTVFEVVHKSQPKYQVREIVPLIQRSVRYVRYSAGTYGVDPNRIGITGASAGGHLSLMAGAVGTEGKPDAKDPVDRESSRVQAIVAIMPPTDIVNWGAPGVIATDIKNMASFIPAFGFTPNESKDQERADGKSISPIYFVSASFPPTLLVHGDSDPLVPVQQSRSMSAALEQAKVDHNLIVSPGTGHDGGTFNYGMPQAVQWFVKHLLKQ